MAKNLLIGEKLRSARLSNRLTLAQVGKTLGVGHGSVAKWERDENNPTLEHLINLAELFDTPTHMLIAENLSAIAAMQHEIEALSEDKQQELALTHQRFHQQSHPGSNAERPRLIINICVFYLYRSKARGGFLP